MKTKRIWAPEDVKAGMIVCRAHRGRDKWKPDGWTAKWTHKIGFVPGDGKMTKDPLTNSYVSNQCCQIAMTDGMVYHRALSEADMAALLTEEDMIPMPWTWWVQMVRFLRRQTNPRP
jgi:hypothetical protein